MKRASNDVVDRRLDHRSIEQFKAEIQEGHKAEWDIIQKFGRIIERETGIVPVIRANGSDMSGRYKSHEEVSCAADFCLGKLLVEVKFDRTFKPYFHLKVHQLESYVEQKAVIIFVRGYGTGQDRIAVLQPDLLLTSYEKIWFEPWQEYVVRIPANDILWARFE